jgi:hypothetical protein
VNQLEGIFALERPLSRPQFVERDTQGIEVTALIDGMTRSSGLLRREIRKCALNLIWLARDLPLSHQVSCEPEIDEARLPRVVVDEKMVRLHVSMSKAARMDSG